MTFVGAEAADLARRHSIARTLGQFAEEGRTIQDACLIQGSSAPFSDAYEWSFRVADYLRSKFDSDHERDFLAGGGVWRPLPHGELTNEQLNLWAWVDARCQRLADLAAKLP